MIPLNEKVAEYFPYSSVRPFQDTFINAIHEAVEKGKHIVLEGSNGLGKTVAALSACLPEAKQRDLKILYTAKTHRQHDRVIEELKAISKKRGVSGLSIRGRSLMCLHPMVVRSSTDARSAMEICELLKREGKCPLYENIDRDTGRFMEIVSHVSSSIYSATEIREICRAEGFCPYEVVKSVLSEVDVIALSYLYIFDPAIRGVFLKHLERPLDSVLLIVDEAHNLPDTAVEVASDSLTLFTIKQAEREARQFNYRDFASFARIFRNFIEKMMSEIREEKIVSPRLLLEDLEKETGLSNLEEFFEELYATGKIIRRRT